MTAGGGFAARAIVSTALFAAGCGGENTSPSGKESGHLTEDAGWAALTDWDRIPSLDAHGYRRFSSNDRNPSSTGLPGGPGNKDFNNFVTVCGQRPVLGLQEIDGREPCDTGEGYVIAAADDGPGYVSRIFLAVGTLQGGAVDSRFGNERISIYVDDLSAPAYEGRIAEWVDDHAAPFADVLSAWTSGAVVSYVPVSYRSKLRVVLDSLRETSIYYYQVDVHSADHTSSFDADVAAVEGSERLAALQRAIDATDAEVWLSGYRSVPAGATDELLSRDTAGTIRRLRLAVSTDDPSALEDVSLRAVWDAEPTATPAVDLPLARLLATEPSPGGFTTLPMTGRVADGEVTLTVQLPMPFASRASLSLVNGGSHAHDVFARIDGTDGPPPTGFGRLHARLSEQSAPASGADRFVLADLRGKGKYAGTVFSFQGKSDPLAVFPDPFNFLEGDETVIVDGRVAARGTGTEEYANGGFYFAEGRFDFPFSALIARDTETTPDGATAGRARAVRWHVPSDGITFEDSFRLEFEYGASHPDTMLRYSAVAIYYLE